MGRRCSSFVLLDGFGFARPDLHRKGGPKNDRLWRIEPVAAGLLDPDPIFVSEFVLKPVDVSSQT
jgi:hypothetical protein